MRILIYVYALVVLLTTGCGKDFLDKKRDANQVVPSKIPDYQALLDHSTVLNYSAPFELMLLGSDEYVLREGAWEAANPIFFYYLRNGYIWADDVYEGKDVRDWNQAYQRILYANMALEVQGIKPAFSEQEEWKNVKGQALFHRSFAYYQLVQTFCKPYNPATADSDRGIPLRTEYDITEPAQITSVQDVYDRIIADLTESVELLPNEQINNYRPSRLAAFALLARIYRELDRWDEALLCAHEVLAVKRDLLDYNVFNAELSYPFGVLNRGLENKEILFYCHTSAGFLQDDGLAQQWIVDLYDEDDLRKTLYFKQGRRFAGSYGSGNFFVGLGIDEVLLIHAEANLKTGKITEAVEDIRYLLANRYKRGSSIAFVEEGEIADLIYSERIKELYMRGTRWTDIRKHNLFQEDKITIVRSAGGIKYTLLPNDPKWVWPWPLAEIVNQ